MGGILSGSRGLAGVVLTFIIGWALIAVVLLTGTVVAAHQIDRDVHVINPRLSGINQNTGEIHLAQQTKSITAQINHAADPLTGELAGTLTAANSIRSTAVTILQRAHSIGSTVGLIHGNVFSIGSTVASIGGNVQSIASSVGGIHSRVASVGADVSSIHASVEGIHSSVDNVLTNGDGILTTSKQIVPRVNGINTRAVSVQGVAGGIQSDLSSTNGLVGIGNAAGTIDGHANAIDCSTLLNATSSAGLQGLVAGLLGGPTTGCGK